MVKEENVSKSLYKLFILMLKVIPMLIALIYLLNTITSLHGVEIPVLSNIAGISLLSWLFMYLATIVFKFCFYHRIFLYYILVTDITSIINYYFSIIDTYYEYLIVYYIIIGIFLFLLLYSHVKDNKRSNTKIT
jgi:hypothetical protein